MKQYLKKNHASGGMAFGSTSRSNPLSSNPTEDNQVELSDDSTNSNDEALRATMTQDSNRREACVAPGIATTSRVVGKKKRKIKNSKELP